MSTALFFALALLAADTEAVATAAPAPAPAPGQPTTEYELVAWCYGALGAHMGLYDVAMPEVTRIERQFERIPGAGKADLESYAVQRKDGQKQLALFRKAMEAAEKASIRPLQADGLAAIRKGEAVWTGAAMADPKHLAREWMSWGLPERCQTTAAQLEAKASVLGQAISYNVTPEAAPEPTDDGLNAAVELMAPEAAPPEETPAE
jgi:hypothetical protein